MGIYNLEKLFTPGPVVIVCNCHCDPQSKEWQLYANLKAGGRPVFLVSSAHPVAATCPLPENERFADLDQISPVPELVISLLSLGQTVALAELCGRLGVAIL